MNGLTHLAIGLIAARVAGADQPLQYLAAGAGSLLPDLDGGGVFSRPLEALLPRLVSRAPVVQIADDVAQTGSSIIRKIFGHRGLLHWPILVGLALALMGRPSIADWKLWLLLGYLAHIYADALTVRGVPLGAPFDLNRVCLLPKLIAIRTGSLAEFLITCSAWTYLAWLIARFIIARIVHA